MNEIIRFQRERAISLVETRSDVGDHPVLNQKKLLNIRSTGNYINGIEFYVLLDMIVFSAFLKDG
jgi:hypothetical protein